MSESFKQFDFSRFGDVLLEDQDLVVSQLVSDDAPALTAVFEGDEYMARYIPWADEPKDEYIARVVRDRAGRGPRYGVRLGGQLLGYLGIFPSPDIPGVIEIGYLLSSAARGQGLLDRAVPAAERLIRSKFPEAKIALCIHDDNLPSQRVAERLGYTRSDQFSGVERVYWSTN